MKAQSVKKKDIKDDSLYGLLSLYKQNNTYFRVLVSNDETEMCIQITDNPANWNIITDEKYSQWRELRRLEMGCSKLSIKYLLPVNIIKIIGPLLGAKIPAEKVRIIDKIEDHGFYILESSIKYQGKFLQALKKISNLAPQKKYEIIEKYLSEGQG